MAASLRIVGSSRWRIRGEAARDEQRPRGADEPAASDLRQRIGALWGWETAERLLAVDRTEHGVGIAGWASPPDVTRGSREDIVVIINGRPVRDPALLQAVLAAYRPLLPRDRFPLVVLGVSLAPADVDANVHPTKAWVRFRQPRVVQEMLVSALHEALRQPAVVPAFGGAAATLDETRLGEVGGLGAAEQHALFQEPLATYVASRFGRVLRQVQDTFIVSTTEDEVFFLDQHVVHERVVFEQVRGQLAAGPLPSQSLLFSETLDLGPAAGLCSSAGASRSSGWGSASRDSAATLWSCAPSPRCSRATSPSA